MKKTFISIVAVAGLVIFSSFKTSESSIVWTGGKVTGSSHTGTVAMIDSDLEFKDNKLTGGYFVADMRSLESTDVSGNSKAKLDGHLKSDDFFGVENYPKAKFKITSVKSGSEKDTYQLTGHMTIKETTREISFPAKVKWEGKRAVATATLNIDRSEYDVRYGSDKFFDNLGDRAIKNNFELEVMIAGSI